MFFLIFSEYLFSLSIIASPILQKIFIVLLISRTILFPSLFPFRNLFHGTIEFYLDYRILKKKTFSRDFSMLQSYLFVSDEINVTDLKIILNLNVNSPNSLFYFIFFSVKIYFPVLNGSSTCRCSVGKL